MAGNTEGCREEGAALKLGEKCMSRVNVMSLNDEGKEQSD